MGASRNHRAIIVLCTLALAAFFVAQGAARLLAEVFFSRDGSQCQLAMFDASAAQVAVPPMRPPTVSATAVAAARPERPAGEGAISAADLESGITRNSDTTFTVARSLVDQLVANPGQFPRIPRAILHQEDGRTVGVKLYGIRPRSILGRLGLQNGDTLRTINGYDMSSPDRALEAYSQLQNARNLSVNVVREGRPVGLEYLIR